MTTLTELSERIALAPGADRELDGAIWAHFDPAEWTRLCSFPGKKYAGHIHTKAEKAAHERNMGAYLSPAFTGSVDAALALLERALPGWEMAMANEYYEGVLTWRVSLGDPQRGCEGEAPTLALAILAALVSALASHTDPTPLETSRETGV